MPLWCTLFFYCPHGEILRARPFDCLTGRATPFEAYVSGTQVVDYELFSKTEIESHEKSMDREIKRDLLESRMGEYANLKREPFMYHDILGLSPCLSDEPIYLSALLELLFKAGYLYPRIHCHFCREPFGVAVLSSTTRVHIPTLTDPGHAHQFTYHQPHREPAYEDWEMI